MKHFLLLLIAIVAGYGLWHVADRTERSIALRQITRHVLRLGAIVIVLVALMLLATQFTASPII